MKDTRHQILLVHWNAVEAKQLSGPLRKESWDVTIEHGGGSVRLSELKANPPIAVVISLRRLPSHGREFADGLWGTKWGRTIPIIFFDGESDRVKSMRKQFSSAIFTTYDALPEKLKQLQMRD